MVFSSLAARAALAVLASTFLAGCNGSDRVPLLDIGAAPARGDVLVGRVDSRRNDRQLLGRVGAPTAYAPARAGTGAQSGIAELSPASAPAARQFEQAQYEQPQTQQPQLAESMTADAAGMDGEPYGAAGAAGGTAMVIPEGGVDMDTGLGVGAETYASADLPSEGAASSGTGVEPQIVTPVGAMAIAEGATSQPVVDGIGFDDPEQIATGPIPSGGNGNEGGVVEVAADDGGEILPLAVDNGNSGMTEQEMVSPAASGVDCSLYLDKRNCPRG